MSLSLTDSADSMGYVGGVPLFNHGSNYELAIECKTLLGCYNEYVPVISNERSQAHPPLMPQHKVN